MVADDDDLRRRLQITKGSPLGCGAFAIVYRATWCGQPCALKVLRPQLANRVPHADQRESMCPAKMLRREGKALMRHPHRFLAACGAVLELPQNFPGLPPGYTKSTPALVLELLEDGSLKRLMRKQQLAPWRPLYDDVTALEWGLQIAHALEHLHGLAPAVVHRDVKLDNIMLQREQAAERGQAPGRERRVAKLADLGLHTTPDLERHQRQPLFRASLRSFCDHDSSFRMGRSLQACQADAPASTSTAAAEVETATRPGSAAQQPVVAVAAAAGTAAAGSPTAAVIAAAGAAPAPTSVMAVPESLFFMQLDGTAQLVPVDPRSPGFRDLSKLLLPLSAAVSMPLTLALPSLGEDMESQGSSEHGPREQRFAEATDADVRQASRDPAENAASAAARVGAHAVVAVHAHVAPGAVHLYDALPSRGAESIMLVSGSSFGERISPLGEHPSAASGAQEVVSEAHAAARSSATMPQGRTELGTNIGAEAGASGRDGSLEPNGLPHQQSMTRTARLLAAAAAAPSSQGSVALPHQAGHLGLAPAERVTWPAGVAGAEGSLGAGGRVLAGLNGQGLPLPWAVGLYSAACDPPAAANVAMPSHGRHAAPTPKLIDDDDVGEEERPTPLGEPYVSGAVGAGVAPPWLVDMSPLAAAPMESHPTADADAAGTYADVTNHGPGSRVSVTPPQALASRSKPDLRVYPLSSDDGRSSLPRNAQAATLQRPVSYGGMVGAPLRPGSSACGLAPPPAARLQRLRPGSSACVTGPAALQLISAARAISRRSLLPSIYCSSPLVATVRTNGALDAPSVVIPCEPVFRLTGETGSCMTMAPEVFKALPYNEKADVFSYGVVLYELFARSMLIVSHISVKRPELPQVFHNCRDYAAAVARGYRPVRPPRVTDPVWMLITDCWHDDPLARPTMTEVVRRLEGIIAAASPAAGPGQGSGVQRGAFGAAGSRPGLRANGGGGAEEEEGQEDGKARGPGCFGGGSRGCTIC